MLSNTIFARASSLNIGKKFTTVVVTKLVEPGTSSLECLRLTCISYQSRATRGRVAPKKLGRVLDSRVKNTSGA